jgi:hypothetical protein
MSVLNGYKLVEPVDGAVYAFGELGVTSAVLERNLDGAGDRLELRLARGLESGPALPLGVRLDLLDAAGTTRFSGWLRAPELRAAGRAEEHRYVLEGPQWWLERIMYLQDGWCFPTDFDELDGDLEAVRHGRVILNQRADFTSATLPEQLADGLVWAQDQGAPISFTLAGMPEFPLPEDEFTDLSVWELLERLLTWLPHWHWRWEYQGGARPRLRFLQAGAARNLAATACTELRAANRRDDLVENLEVQFVSTLAATLTEGPDSQVRRSWLGRATQASAGTAGTGGRVRSTLYLRGSLRALVLDEETGEYAEEVLIPGESAPETNLAEVLHTAYSQPAMAWEARLEGAEADWGWLPGDRLRITGVHAGWEAGAAPAAVIRTVRHTLELGRTEILAGPPARLLLPRLLEALRGRNPASSFAERATGEGSPTKGSFGADKPAAGRIRIYGCAEGQPVYYLFRPSAVNGPFPV